MLHLPWAAASLRKQSHPPHDQEQESTCESCSHTNRYDTRHRLESAVSQRNMPKSPPNPIASTVYVLSNPAPLSPHTDFSGEKNTKGCGVSPPAHIRAVPSPDQRRRICALQHLFSARRPKHSCVLILVGEEEGVKA